MSLVYKCFLKEPSVDESSQSSSDIVKVIASEHHTNSSQEHVGIGKDYKELHEIYDIFDIISLKIISPAGVDFLNLFLDHQERSRGGDSVSRLGSPTITEDLSTWVHSDHCKVRAPTLAGFPYTVGLTVIIQTAGQWPVPAYYFSG